MLALRYDREQDRSDLVVLDASEFGGDPVAVVPLPRRVPWGSMGVGWRTEERDHDSREPEMRGRSIIPLWLGLMLLATCGVDRTALARSGAGDDPDAIEFFEKSIRPIFAEKCQKCHGGDKAKGGLSLTGREALLKGGDSGPAAVPGRPRDSLLIQAVERRGDLKMPPKGKLSSGEIERLGRWIERGLPWPEAESHAAAPADREAAQPWWSFRPVRAMLPPPLKDTAGPCSEIDRFILAGLETRGLDRPSPPANAP